MPYDYRIVPDTDCYEVFNVSSGKVFAKCTTKELAESQLRLLRGIEANPSFRRQIKERRLAAKKRSDYQSRKKNKRPSDPTSFKTTKSNKAATDLCSLEVTPQSTNKRFYSTTSSQNGCGRFQLKVDHISRGAG